MEGLSFDQAVELFGLYCKSKGLAPRTVETYMFALEGLQAFLEVISESARRVKCLVPPFPVPDYPLFRSLRSHLSAVPAA